MAKILPAIAVSLAAALVLPGAAALAQGQYSDSATSQWFKSLGIAQLVPNCCDQSDCHEVKAEWRGGTDGAWWAESRYWPDEWVKIPASHIVNTPNPLAHAVLCEVKDGRSDFISRTVPSGFGDAVYCFVPPPDGF